jgi:hypothetical protein
MRTLSVTHPALDEIFYLSHTSVLVTAPKSSYKQHILSSAEVRKVSYSSGELKVRSLYLISSRTGGLKFMKYFKGSGATIKFSESPAFRLSQRD